MSTGGDPPQDSSARLVLFADISGSTRLFEEHGDVLAREACAACLAVVAGVVERFHGRVVKTIGDEVMAAFEDPSRGVMAATETQGAVRRANEEGRFATGELRIKVGLHYGAAVDEGDDVRGEAASVAQEVIRMAKADQVLTTRPTLEAVPAMLRSGSRFQDRMASHSTGASFDVHELIWEVTGLTQTADSPIPQTRSQDERLELACASGSAVCDADKPLVRLGRVAGNDLVLDSDLTSRFHAEVEYRRGRFYLRDNSANGTLVLPDEGATVTVRREELPLRGHGRLCLGGNPERTPAAVVAFRCE